MKWAREELKQMNQWARKHMMKRKTLYPWDNVDRLYVPRKEGGRDFASIEDSINTSIQRLEEYIKTLRKTDHSDRKQYRQHKHQQKKCNQKTKMLRKELCEHFKRQKKRNLTRENLNIAKKGKPLERKWISSDSCKKQRNKD